MVEAKNEHNIAFLSCADYHVSEESLMLADIEECKTILKSVLLDKEADSV